jgi:hypothetical protein
VVRASKKRNAAIPKMRLKIAIRASTILHLLANGTVPDFFGARE